MPKPKDALLAVGAGVVVIAVLAVGFQVLGPPQSQRAISADERPVQDLRMIAQQIFGRHALPSKLTELATGTTVDDPVTHTPYEFHAKAGTHYELCAVFTTASAEGDTEYPQPNSFWKHGKGRQCFQLDAVQAPAW